MEYFSFLRWVYIYVTPGIKNQPSGRLTTVRTDGEVCKGKRRGKPLQKQMGVEQSRQEQSCSNCLG